jgi:hypothetical protein
MNLYSLLVSHVSLELEKCELLSLKYKNDVFLIIVAILTGKLNIPL